MTCARCQGEFKGWEGEIHYPNPDDYRNDHYFLCACCCDEYCHDKPEPAN